MRLFFVLQRDGTQLLNSLSGKTEKVCFAFRPFYFWNSINLAFFGQIFLTFCLFQATCKAKRFIHAGVKNVKFHGKNGFKEAVKGIKERKKNSGENNKGTVSAIKKIFLIFISSILFVFVRFIEPSWQQNPNKKVQKDFLRAILVNIS